MQTAGEILHHPTVGESAPDKTVLRAQDGAEIALSSLWQHGPALLIFLRHIRCTFCREQVAHLAADQDRFSHYGASIGLVTMGTLEDTERFCRERSLATPFVCLNDPDRLAYQAYGLSRGGPHELFTAHVLARGFQAALHGHFNGIPKTDPFQMPGVFIVDRTGIVRYAHRHQDAADNPPNSELLSVLANLNLPADETGQN